MIDQEKAKQLSQEYGGCENDCCSQEVYEAAMKMATWKDTHPSKETIRKILELAGMEMYFKGQMMDDAVDKIFNQLNK